VIDSDELLLERLRQGDEAAFEALFLRYHSRVYRVVHNLVGSREEAEDLAQETFLSLYHQPPAPDTAAAVFAWLCRVGLNRGYNALRSQQRAARRLAFLAEPPAVIDPHAEVVRAEQRSNVRAALAQLPERQGKLLLLRHAGLAYAEIAAVLEIAPGSVGTLLARAERAFMATYQRMDLAEHEDALDTRTS
jgi:RNA polymerase sigma-70 factor (ECF subfamily)